MGVVPCLYGTLKNKLLQIICTVGESLDGCNFVPGRTESSVIQKSKSRAQRRPEYPGREQWFLF